MSFSIPWGFMSHTSPVMYLLISLPLASESTAALGRVVVSRGFLKDLGIRCDNFLCPAQHGR